MTAQDIRKGRAERGMTQGDLAKKAGLSIGSINSYEHGTRNITKSASSKISAAFKSVKTLNEQEPARSLLAELSDANTNVQWEGTRLRPMEIELLRVIAKTLVEQRK